MLLNRRVNYVDSLYSRRVEETIRAMKRGDIVLLENLRFSAEEVTLKKYDGWGDFSRQGNSLFMRRLAGVADYFVCDAFAASHRSQPSLVGLVEHLPSMAGAVLERELVVLGEAMNGASRPTVAVLGGAKADDSVAIAKNMLKKGSADTILPTGVVGNVFLMASGVDVGQPSTDFVYEKVDNAEETLDLAKELLETYRKKIELPTDVALFVDGKRKPALVSDLPSDYPIFDIGLDTIAHFSGIIKKAGTIIANGPAGVFENRKFAMGTREIFRAIAESEGFSIVGGGETITVIDQMELHDRINHVSTGGGALLAFLGGRTLPVKDALEKSRQMYKDGKYESKECKN
jgi:phosphoglycerate kinase